MKNKITFHIFCLCVIPLFTSFKINEPKVNWVLEKSKNGIIVYSHIPEGHKIKQIKVKTTSKTTLSAVISVLKEVEDYPKWIYNCTSSYVVTQKNNKEMVYYSETSTPWPLQNRDLVVKNIIIQDEKTKEIRSISIPYPNKIAEKADLVRITDFYGEWKFTPINTNEISIEYFLSIDPAGNIPAWMLNMFIDIGPYQTIEKFKELIVLPKHKNANFDYIEN